MMKKIPADGMVILLLAFIITGCCSIMNSTTQKIAVSSNPPGALVTLNGQQKGSTPITLELKRKVNHKITIQTDGYQPYEIITTRSPSFWVLGDLLFTLPLVAIDAIDGAVYTIEPTIIQVQLLKKHDETMNVDPDNKVPEKE